jgi:UDP-GlcNAc:undecaprenyl-phosphate GlcNAc-1-phosphate transferase
MTWIDGLEIFITTTIISYLTTPLFRKIALKTNYLDCPLNTKSHAHPTPLLGGVGIYAAFVIGILTSLKVSQDPRLIGLIMGSTILLAIGLIDDRMGMMPEVKLLGQFLAAMAVVKSGLHIDFFPNYYVNVILTYLWIVGITNSFNLLDNMNGLSAGIAVIAGLFFGIAMWTGKQVEVALVSFALAGSCLGFLKHNFPRASIFMGDTGSLVIGFLLASTAILGSWSTRFLTTSLSMPFIILGYPIFDTVLVIIMRLKEGRSIFQGGRDHSSHRLALLGFRKRRAVLAIYAVCLALGASALVIQRVSLKAALFLILVVAISLAAFGIRLGMVRTGRYGRKKLNGQV